MKNFLSKITLGCDDLIAKIEFDVARQKPYPTCSRIDRFWR